MIPAFVPPARLFWLAALSLSIGWGIRGNFGHEFGAMIPGALAAMAVVLASGREDWQRRIHHFGFWGALGWSFGGSISYMQVIAYTHSGHSGTVAYGFACLFVIGFLWAAIGGAGTALPAFLDRERLTGLLAPLVAVFVAWVVQTAVEARLNGNPDFRQQDPLYWYDTDWLAATTAPAAVLLLAAIRRRWDAGTSLVLHMAAGWWLCIFVLVDRLGLRMTPPRGDNWAGCMGMVIGLWIWLARGGLPGVVRVSLVSGVVGGLGFSTAALFELVELKSGWQTNWHSILEQTYGFINGAGLAVAMWWAARHAPPVAESPAPMHRWTDVFAAAFVILVVPWLNQSKNVADWVKAGAVPATMHGLPAAFWFHLAWAAFGLVVLAVLIRQLRRPLALLPETWLGRGQLLYLALLWWMVAGNFERALVGFREQRLVTEGVIHLNAAICSALLLLGTATTVEAAALAPEAMRRCLRKAALSGLAVFVVAIAAQWSLTRALYGDQPAGFHRLHIRFGPNATATKAKPAPGQPHP